MNFFQKLMKPFVSDNVKQKWQLTAQEEMLQEWNDKGRPAPAPHLHKQQTLKHYQQQYGFNTLVETGTFMGDMVEAQKKNFKKVISIELAEELFKKATQRFEADNNVQIVQGDSGKVLPQILKDIHEPVLFWLDGHYSAGATARGEKDCPIFEEIDAILTSNHPAHGLLIDDARLFVGTGDYPTIDELTTYINHKNASYRVEVKDDIIRFTI